MLIDGQKGTKSDLVYYGIGCYRSRQKSYSPKQYCFGEREYDFNIWGCRRMNMPLLFGEWLTYGRFDKSGIWYFDRQKIYNELKKYIHENRLCPVLNPKHIIETLKKFPESVNPKTNKSWNYNKQYREINGDYKEVAIGVEPILKKANEFIIGDFLPKYEFENSTQDNSQTIEINIDANEIVKNLKKKKTRSKGCLTISTIAVIIIIIVITRVRLF
jgi:hypothetical protein